MKSDSDYAQEPRALREVREWKAKVWEDVKELPFDEAVRIIAQRAHETAVAFGFRAVATPAYPARVAETGGRYGAHEHC
ncbi:MAG: hypothetical protein WCK89_14605 [bacterium]